jgi:peptidoglycan/xylan/chitin deacetylase (PgdA/CDA1 family)
MKNYWQRIALISVSVVTLMSFSTRMQAETPVQTLPLPGTVTLTIDDGPSPIYTPQILAILRHYNIKATFFVVGDNAKRYPELIRQIAAEGHVVASHSLTHPILNKVNAVQLAREVITPQNIIYAILDKKPKCLRPPFGAANQRVKDFIRSQGITPVSMGFNSFDYERPGVDKIVAWVLKNTHARQVFLFHDGYKHKEQTVTALPEIIIGIQKKGLGFSTICS